VKIVGNRPKPKTWSLLGDVKRKPSDYEVVTAKFHSHFRREPAPFEIDPQAPINVWYVKHREGSPFQVADWEGFRDPAKLYYKEYVTLQHDREGYLDKVIERHEDAGSVAALPQEWVEKLGGLFVPLRFPLHILQMCSLYVGQMAPSAFITNPAHFQAADEMRRIQRIAYTTRLLANAFGNELAQTPTARVPWENGAAWQPMRKLLEELLIAYDWGEAFVALNLVVKPMLDATINGQIGALATRNGDDLISALLVEFGRDSDRSAAWSQALVGYALKSDPSLRGLLDGWLTTWQPKARAAVAGYAELFTGGPNGTDASEVVKAVDAQYGSFLDGCGLS
jgi:toluene monooxygenase system protein E